MTSVLSGRVRSPQTIHLEWWDKILGYIYRDSNQLPNLDAKCHEMNQDELLVFIINSVKCYIHLDELFKLWTLTACVSFFTEVVDSFVC